MSQFLLFCSVAVGFRVNGRLFVRMQLPIIQIRTQRSTRTTQRARTASDRTARSRTSGACNDICQQRTAQRVTKN
ncbi:MULTISPECIES: hypothetical protein [unclassified Paraburkholderia]|uniref:hypothetical protein n=1 Tax=unclassified Paraburkholderia TaxID=2615204 RepID=UPI002AB0B06A|nr:MULTISPECIES: hypothetical protein [unclassified Paraburkholderia]